ncbi:MAG: hypothetical protein II796_01580 [Oscillospiraceae bacterium]|nr:hypothetical protein [Oscillospiraceae bacterium]
MNNLFSFIKKLLISNINKPSKAQQQKLDEISDNEYKCIQIILDKCKSWNNSDYIHYIKLIEQSAEKQKAKVLKN